MIDRLASSALAGFLFIDKPTGPTSHDIVAALRRALKTNSTAIKVGHAGTLDPAASGLLILGIGNATKQLGTLLGQDKAYEATVQLGATTTTDDAEAVPVPTADLTLPERTAVEKAVRSFLGNSMQTPPAYSAKKVHGVAAYTYARRGIALTLAPVPICITEIDLHSYEAGSVTLSLRCSSGTYIRALARDLGTILGTGGYITHLRRTSIGPFSITEALPLTALDDTNLLEQISPIQDVIARIC